MIAGICSVILLNEYDRVPYAYEYFMLRIYVRYSFRSSDPLIESAACMRYCTRTTTSKTKADPPARQRLNE